MVSLKRAGQTRLSCGLVPRHFWVGTSWSDHPVHVGAQHLVPQAPRRTRESVPCQHTVTGDSVSTDSCSAVRRHPRSSSTRHADLAISLLRSSPSLYCTPSVAVAAVPSRVIEMNYVPVPPTRTMYQLEENTVRWVKLKVATIVMDHVSSLVACYIYI